MRIVPGLRELDNYEGLPRARSATMRASAVMFCRCRFSRSPRAWRADLRTPRIARRDRHRRARPSISRARHRRHADRRSGGGLIPSGLSAFSPTPEFGQRASGPRLLDKSGGAATPVVYRPFPCEQGCGTAAQSAGSKTLRPAARRARSSRRRGSWRRFPGRAQPRSDRRERDRRTDAFAAALRRRPVIRG